MDSAIYWFEMRIQAFTTAGVGEESAGPQYKKLYSEDSHKSSIDESLFRSKNCI